MNKIDPFLGMIWFKCYEVNFCVIQYSLKIYPVVSSGKPVAASDPGAFTYGMAQKGFECE